MACKKSKMHVVKVSQSDEHKSFSALIVNTAKNMLLQWKFGEKIQNFIRGSERTGWPDKESNFLRVHLHKTLMNFLMENINFKYDAESISSDVEISHYWFY